MYRRGEVKPDIGMLVKIWETAKQKRVVKVVWFFRPIEITHWLGDIKVLDNELLLASDEGVGLSDVNAVEAITGKCNVVCISTDWRNPQPTDEELDAADFVFFRTFNVRTCKISEKFPIFIASIEVEHFFNKGTDQQQPVLHGGKHSFDKPRSLSSFEGAATWTAAKDGYSGRNTQSMLPLKSQVKQTRLSAKNVSRARANQASVNTSGEERELKKASVSSCGQGTLGNISTSNEKVDSTEGMYSSCTLHTNVSDSPSLMKKKLQYSQDATYEQNKVMTSGQVAKVVRKGTIASEGQGRQHSISVMDETFARTKITDSDCTATASLSDSCFLEKRKLQDSLGTAPFEPRKVMKSGSPVSEVIGKGGQGGQSNISAADETAARTEIKHSHCISPSSLSDPCVWQKRKSQESAGIAPSDQPMVIKPGSQVTAVTQAKEGGCTWFKQQPWDERLHAAEERGRLVLLENLDPSYTSTEVEEIVWDSLKEKVSAKMVQHSTFSNPLIGKAFVIFKTSERAETAVSELKRRCLILDGRPVVARRGTIAKPVKSSDFPGHLSIPKIKFQLRGDDMGKAVSTSHHSQGNTIEHEMALEWLLLQESSSLWWQTLYEGHIAKIDRLSSQLKAPSSKLKCV